MKQNVPKVGIVNKSINDFLDVVNILWVWDAGGGKKSIVRVDEYNRDCQPNSWGGAAALEDGVDLRDRIAEPIVADSVLCLDVIFSSFEKFELKFGGDGREAEPLAADLRQDGKDSIVAGRGIVIEDCRL